jgi:uncharacterized damage-inducible protein DinB
MPHPLVSQLRFARSELRRALEGVTDAESARRFEPMNCISWNVGHLAWQEQRLWLFRGQNRLVRPDVNERFASGGPPSTPALSEAWEAWREIASAADPWLDALTTEKLIEPHRYGGGREGQFTFGSLLQRTIYHYWYHTGESLAIRQMLGHRGLPEFVGNLDDEAPYRPE